MYCNGIANNISKSDNLRLSPPNFECWFFSTGLSIGSECLQDFYEYSLKGFKRFGFDICIAVVVIQGLYVYLAFHFDI